MARNNLSSFVSRVQRIPFWLPVLLACFLFQTLIPSGYMPGNLSSGESALVFCGDTAFLDPNEPDISALLDGSDHLDYGEDHSDVTNDHLAQDTLAHDKLSHGHVSHENNANGISHCLFAFSCQLGQSAPALTLATGLFADSDPHFAKHITSSPAEPNHIRPLLRAPPHLSS